MKKLACILLVVTISVATFAKGSGRRYVASLDNNQVVKSQREQRAQTKSFATEKRYSSVVNGRGMHIFGKKGAASGASNPESGLGL